MKTWMISLAGLLLGFSAIPSAVAEEATTFHAVSRLPAEARPRLAALDDGRLAEVEGGRRFSGRQRGIPATNVNLNVSLAVINQFNVCVMCNGTTQTNAGGIEQSSVQVLLSRFR
jgi:hypothetical protein